MTADIAARDDFSTPGFYSDRLSDDLVRADPAVLFGGRDKVPLRVPMPAFPLRELRLRARRTGILNITRLAAVNDTGASVDLASSALNASSVHGCGRNADDHRFRTRLAEIGNNLFGAPASYGGYHSEMEDEPWLSVAMVRPTALRQLEIYTRGNRYAQRAWFLAVEALADDGTWHVVHDQGHHLDDVFASSAQRAENELPNAAARLYKSLLATVRTFVDEGKLKSSELVRNGKAEKLSARQIQMAKPALNGVFARFELELTIHSLSRSFRFWSAQEKSRSIQHASDVIDFLTQHVGPACLGFGTCLGAVRDGDLIPHDDDLDVIVARHGAREGSFGTEVDEVLAILSKHGVKSYRCSDYHLKMSLQPRQILDVFCAASVGEKLAWHPGSKNAFAFQDMFPACAIDLLGNSVLIPRNVVHYLQSVYGESWRVPNPGFWHRWSRDGET